MGLTRSLKSSAVNTATTPGAARAAEQSMRANARMRLIAAAERDVQRAAGVRSSV